ncbi:MAG: hypothetical protein V3T72_05930 [Thermoanaerobaculia bacterium]
MRATATFDSMAAGIHPDLDRWIAYHSGATGGDDTVDLQDHLASCRDCTTLVLDLEAFADPVAADSRAAVSDFEKATAWRALRLAPAKKWYVPATLAASFLAAAVGLSGWLQQQREVDGLRREIADLTRPQANVPVHDLYLDTTLRSAARDSSIEIPAAATNVTLILNQLMDTRGDELRAQILDAAGQTVATVEGLELDELGVATLGLSRGTLDSGDYVVRVEVLRGGGWIAIGDYPLQLRFH